MDVGQIFSNMSFVYNTESVPPIIVRNSVELFRSVSVDLFVNLTLESSD